MDKSELINEQVVGTPEEPSEPSETVLKKKFVVPQISVPVDVLEATTFFQAIASGATN